MSGPFGAGGLQFFSAADLYTYKLEQSLRFNSADGAQYLSLQNSSAGNKKTFTWCGWIKRSNIMNDMALFSSANTVSSDLPQSIEAGLSIQQDNTFEPGTINATNSYGSINFVFKTVTSPSVIIRQVWTSLALRDTASWTHIHLIADSTQTTSSDRIKVYQDGTRITSFRVTNYPQLNDEGTINNSSNYHFIGYGSPQGSTDSTNGYMAEVHFFDGTAVAPTEVGEFKNGVWVPKEYTGSAYGTNGFKLNFSNSSSLGADSSGQGNNFTVASALAATDQVLDSPTRNYSTLNPLGYFCGDVTFTEGNLKISTPSSGSNFETRFVPSTHHMTNGKWYAEVRHTAAIGSYAEVGVIKEYAEVLGKGSITTNGWGYSDGGEIRNNNSLLQSSLATFTSGDIIGIAFDADNGTLQFYKNNSAVGSQITGLDTDAMWNFFQNGNLDFTSVWNFGQDSSFAGAVTAQGNGGIGEDFYYTPPSGYKALAAFNYKENSISPALANQPEKHYNSVTYTGTGVAQSITGVGFTPGITWLWRSGETMFDIVRGVTKQLKIGISDTTQIVETTDSNSLTSFDTDGFSVGTSTETNDSGDPYIAFNFKLGGAATTNTQGSINTEVSANTAAGMSAVSYLGSAANATIGHGLVKAPEFIMFKNRDTQEIWWAYHHRANYTGLTSNDPEDYYISMGSNSVGASYPNATYLQSTAPTSSVISIGPDHNVNGPSENMLAYCFHEVDGFSKFGVYQAYDKNSAGLAGFIPLPFKPAFIIIKSINTTTQTDWVMFDFNSYGNYGGNNTSNHQNFPASILNRGVGSLINENIHVEMFSNGFRVQLQYADVNEEEQSGTPTYVNYVYAAFAKMPLKYSTAV